MIEDKDTSNIDFNTSAIVPNFEGQTFIKYLNGVTSIEAKTCRWSVCDDDYYVYETTCNNIHQFMEGYVKDNSYKYCPYCGLQIEEI
jgi:hypothetical protein